MKNLIKVDILCSTENNAKLKDLGIEVEDKGEYKEGYLVKDLITFFYSTSKGGATIVEFIDGTSVEVEQDLITFVKGYED